VAAVAPAVSPSLASAYAPANAWLTQDANPTGKVPVTTGPSESIDNPVSGTAAVQLNVSPLDWTEPELAVQAPQHFAEAQFPHSGPWPAIPDASQGKEPWGTWPDDGKVPAGYYKVPPEITGLYQTNELYQGHDRHSQDVDTAGWEQYTPSTRTPATRRGWWQDYLGVQDFWPVTQPNLARTRVAMGANQNVGGTVAQYGGLASSGGNTAYEPAAPPAVTTQQPVTGTGTIPTWGF
jgi:hypothetical protein